MDEMQLNDLLEREITLEEEKILARLAKAMPDLKFKDCDVVTGRPTKPISWKVLNTSYNV